ncbi:hypothetical protein [Phaffia rhodozyma]|uniref:Uncharacterized protein n=1 Tax=Phaffia rhodozyma TaxID=264483 RepID=A0A0F7SM98_PHARH|nr:hypothetical protein [Phaffia rhodozyma]
MSRPTYIVFTNPPTRKAVRRYIQSPPEISEHPFKRVKLQLDWHTSDILDPILTVSPSLCDHALVPSPSSPRLTPVQSTSARPTSVAFDAASGHLKDAHVTVVEATFDEFSREGRRSSNKPQEAVGTVAERRGLQQTLGLVAEDESTKIASSEHTEPRRDGRSETPKDEAGDVSRALEEQTKLTTVLDIPVQRNQDKAMQEQSSCLDYASIILPTNHQTLPLVSSASNSNNDPAPSVAQPTYSTQSSVPYPDMTTFSFLHRTRPRIVEPHSDVIQHTTPADRPSREKSQEQETDKRQDAGERSVLHSTRLEELVAAPIASIMNRDESIDQGIGPSTDDRPSRLEVPNLRTDSTSIDMNSIRELSMTSFSFTVAADTSAAASAVSPTADVDDTVSEPNDSTRPTEGPRRTSNVLNLVKESLRELNSEEGLQTRSSISRKTARQATRSSASLLTHVDQPLETSLTTHSPYSLQSSTESSFLPTQADTQPRPSVPSSVHSETSIDQAYPPHPNQPQKAHPTHPYIHSNLLRPLPTFGQPLDQPTANFLTVVTSVELKSFVGKDGRSWLLGELELFDGKNVGRLVVWGHQAREWCDGVGIRKGDVVLFERITIVQPKPPSRIQTLQAFPLDPQQPRSRPRNQPISAYTIFYRTSLPLPGESAEEWGSKRADLRWRTSDTGLGLVGRLKDWVESAGV